MPVKRIQFPDGSIHRVEVPDGATNEEILDFVTSQHPAAQADFSDVTHSSRTAQGLNRNRPLDAVKEAVITAMPQLSPDWIQGGLHGLGQMAMGLGQAAVEGGPGGIIAHKIADAVRPQTLTDLVRGTPQLDPMQQASAAIGRQAASSRQAFEASPAGHTLLGKTSAVVGQYGPTVMIPGGGATIPARLATAALGGAASTAVIPVESGDYASQKGAQAGIAGGFGVLGGLAGEGLHSAAQLFQKVKESFPSLSPTAVAQKVQQILQEHAYNPASLAKPNPSRIPGVQRTLAEESGDPGIAQLQRQFPVQMQETATANNAKRMDYLRSQFGGASPEAVAAQRQATTNAAGPDLQEARKQVGAETGRLLNWLDRAPNTLSFRGNENVAKALSQVRNRIAAPIDDAGRLSAARGVAKDAIENKGRMSSADFQTLLDARRAIISGQMSGMAADDVLRSVSKMKPTSLGARAALDDMRAALRKAEYGKDDVASLYEARKTITREQMPAAIKSGDGATIKALKGVIGQLDERITAVAPTYAGYLKNYRNGMKVADQIKVGANMVSRGTVQQTGERGIQPGAFLRATDNLSSLLPTSAQRYGVKPEKLMTPQQISAIGNLRDDLVRVKDANELGRGVGSPTKPNMDTGAALKTAMGDTALSKAVGLLPWGAQAMQTLNGISEGRANSLLLAALKDPEKARGLLSMLPPNQQAAIEGLLAGFYRPGRAVAAASSGAIARDQSADK